MPWTPDDLTTVLLLDFRADDLGDDVRTFDARLETVVSSALSRTTATPDQQEAGARYALLSAWIRQLTRQTESLSIPGEISLTQGLAVRLGQLRADQRKELALSGLPGVPSVTRPSSVIVPVTGGF